MPLTDTSLAIAADKISEVLQAVFNGEVLAIVDTPAAAQKLAESSPNKHLLNIFFYRIAPSGFHAAQTNNEPLFLRVSALLTPFPKKTNTAGEEYPELRILGEVVRHFHENPISAQLATPQGQNGTAYRLQTVLQAPTMEELNHIWTTQGSDMSYRTSAAYEFALVPVDPLQAATPAGDVTTALIEVEPEVTPPDGPSDYTLEFTPHPAEAYDGSWPAPPHLPQILAVGTDGPAGTVDVPAGAGEIMFALAGEPGSRARINLSIRDGAGQELRTATRLRDVKTPLLDADVAKFSFDANLTGAKTVIAEVVQTDAAGSELQPRRVGNTLTITVDGGA